LPFTPPKPLDPAPREVAGSTVLVVDDERAWRLILETDLRMLGYRVSLAQDGVEALDKARRDRPHVAIVDLMLPEPMDGSLLPSELRAQGTPLPVIFFTAYPVFSPTSDDPDVIGYLSKAEDRADLYAMLPGAIKMKTSRP
jgi:CheY-like chemotaxis protein